MKQRFLLLFLYLAGALFSQQTTLLQDAYQSMLRGEYATAEVQYRNVLSLQPNNSDAWEGLLWAQNSLGKFHSTLADSKRLLKSNQARSSIYPYRAYALQSLHRYPEARYYYQLALADSTSTLESKARGEAGLASAYLGLNDYPRFDVHNSQAAHLQLLPRPRHKASFLSSVYHKLPGTDKSAWGLNQSFSYRAAQLNLGHERFMLNDAYFRSVSKAMLGYQLKGLQIKADGRILQGEDERVYPAQQAGLYLEPRMYYRSLALRPAAYASYSHYPRFDVQQLSLSGTMLVRDINITYAFHYLYLDNEAASTDSTHLSQELSLTKRLPWNLNLGLHYGTGNYTWLVDSSGAINDTFNQNGTYYGASLSLPLFNRVYLYALHQRWQDDSLSYASLSVRY